MTDACSPEFSRVCERKSPYPHLPLPEFDGARRGDRTTLPACPLATSLTPFKKTCHCWPASIRKVFREVLCSSTIGPNQHARRSQRDAPLSSPNVAFGALARAWPSYFRRLLSLTEHLVTCQRFPCCLGQTKNTQAFWRRSQFNLSLWFKNPLVPKRQ